MALIDDSPRTASVVSKTSCRLAQIDRRRFHFLVQQTPHFATYVMKTLADGLRHMKRSRGGAITKRRLLLGGALIANRTASACAGPW